MSCSECGGSGSCTYCHGSGECPPGILEGIVGAVVDVATACQLPDDNDYECKHCGGSGNCPVCNGSGE
jgi:hypothetical protein